MVKGKVKREGGRRGGIYMLKYYSATSVVHNKSAGRHQFNQVVLQF